MFTSIAEEVANKYNTRNPKSIAMEMGIDVIYMPFDELYGLACSLDEYRLIGVNSCLDEPIQNLVIAHELGHFFLHPQDSFYFIHNHTFFYNKFEYQANLFAVALCFGEEVARHDSVKELAACRIEDIVKIL